MSSEELLTNDQLISGDLREMEERIKDLEDKLGALIDYIGDIYAALR